MSGADKRVYSALGSSSLQQAFRLRLGFCGSALGLSASSVLALPLLRRRPRPARSLAEASSCSWARRPSWLPPERSDTHERTGPRFHGTTRTWCARRSGEKAWNQRPFRVAGGAGVFLSLLPYELVQLFVIHMVANAAVFFGVGRVDDSFGADVQIVERFAAHLDGLLFSLNGSFVS